MQPPDRIETARLVLRRPRIEDAADIFEGDAQDPEVTRYLTWRPHTTLEETRGFVEGDIAEWEHPEGGYFSWVITVPPEDRAIGMIGVRIADFKVEIGYVLARAHWGHGLMTEAATAVVDWAYARPEVFRVWAVCDVENHASARVLEKAGMLREGILRRWTRHPNAGGEPVDCLCYARAK